MNSRTLAALVCYVFLLAVSSIGLVSTGASFIINGTEPTVAALLNALVWTFSLCLSVACYRELSANTDNNPRRSLA